MSTEVMGLYLVRHAESANNVISVDFRKEGWAKFLRHADPPLSPTGEEQVTQLKDYMATSEDPLPAYLRSQARGNSDRFAVFSSPMRRTLKTSYGLCSGIGYRDAKVHPTVFEQGGCYHQYPELSEMKGLERLQTMNPTDLLALHKSEDLQTYSGISAIEVTDAAHLKAFIGCDGEEAFAPFISGVAPGYDMTKGWYVKDTVETRSECFTRATEFVEWVTDLAKKNVLDNIVVVCHGDFMDVVLKNLTLGDCVPVEKRDRMSRYVHTNTGITRVEIARDDCQAHVLYQNRCNHLTSAATHTGGEMLNGWKWSRDAERSPKKPSKKQKTK